MDVVAIAALSVAGGAVIIMVFALIARSRFKSAVLESLARIGVEAPRRGKPAALTAAFDRLERESVLSQRDRAQLAGALEAASIGILTTNDGAVVTFANDLAMRQLDVHTGSPVAEPAVRKAIDEAVVSRVSVSTELELVSPHRRVITIEAVPLDFGVESFGVAVFVTDVTNVRRVDAVRRDFIANVSHELKTPLGALAVLAETMSMQLDDPTVTARLAQRLTVEAGRLSELVDAILDLSQAEALSSAAEPVPVGALIAEAVEQARGRHGADGVEIIVGVVDPELRMAGDRRQLRSLFANLVDNAVKYSDANEARVLVAVTTEPGVICITVTDEGIGIPAAHVDRIFERFYRVDRARSRSTGGSGLGLAIVRHVALNHGGSVEVQSSPGVGSTFFVRLPNWERR